MRISLDIPFLLSDLLRSLNANVSATVPQDIMIHHICTDSRSVLSYDLFIGIKGYNFDGNDFIGEAKYKGSITIGNTSSGADIEVENSNDALLLVAKFYKSLFTDIKACIAITGSVGKTSTKEFTKKILKASSKAHATYGNYNNFVGIAHTIFTMPKATEYVIFELGMNHFAEISKMSKCIEPDVAIITGIGSSHIGYLGSKEDIALAKAEIADGMHGGFIIIPEGEKLLSEIPNKISVGYNRQCAFSLSKKLDESYTYAYPDGALENMSIPLESDHMLQNVALAITAAVLLKLPAEDIKTGVKTINNADMRIKYTHLSDFTILDDSYNASYESICADFKFIFDRFGGRPIGALLGDINELGEYSEDIHTAIGRLCANYPLSNLYLIGKFAPYIEKGALDTYMDKSKIHVNTDPYDFDTTAQHIKINHLRGELILFKASHALRLDRIADILARKERSSND